MSQASLTSTYRIQKDLKEIVDQSACFAAPVILASPVDDHLQHLVGVVMGPPGTPYAGGFLSFEVRFGTNYPNEPPRVRLLSTEEGKLRLNPNLYADGNVCLSILGTWRGETTEVWRSTYSALYVLQVIQSIILNSEPYHNEPGFEKESLKKGISLLVSASFQEEKVPEAKGSSPGAAHPPSEDSSLKEKKTEGKSAEDLEAAMNAMSLQHKSKESNTTDEKVEPNKKTPPKKRLHISREQMLIEREQYSQKITHECLRVCVCHVMEALLCVDVIPALTEEKSEGGEVAGGGKTPFSPEASPGLTPTQPFPMTVTTTLLESPSSSLEATSKKTSSYAQVQQNLLTSTHIHLFSKEIKRQFLVWYPQYVATCKRPELVSLDGTSFQRMPFESMQNQCQGVFRFYWLAARLEKIYQALENETEAWKAKGAELTKRMSYSACTLQDESNKMASELSGVSGGIVDASNAFVWHVTFLQSEGLYEESMYQAEIVFCDDQPPRVKFLQSILHPHISTLGHPFYFLFEHEVAREKRVQPMQIISSLQRLLTQEFSGNPCTWLNPEAGEAYFSHDPAVVKAFKSKVRRLARRSSEM